MKIQILSFPQIYFKQILKVGKISFFISINLKINYFKLKFYMIKYQQQILRVEKQLNIHTKQGINIDFK